MPRPIFPGRPGLAIPRNWKTDDDHGTAFTLIKWEALQVYAIDLKKRITNSGDDVPCWLSTEYSKGGCHIVRQICFQDGTNWAVRVQLREVTETSCQRLVHEVNTIQDLQNQSKVPVPKVIAYEKDKNPVGVAFMISEFISACTAMDFVSDQPMDRAIPQRFKRSYFSEIAAVQVEMSSIRFDKIGSVIKNPDGKYTVGPIPNIGGPFDTAADFFQHWSNQLQFPTDETGVRKLMGHRPDLFDSVWGSIRDFPSQLSDLARRRSFQSGPFPIFHTDFYRSNVLVDSNYRIQKVIDWDNAFVAPWELVEFPKDLCSAPPSLLGSSYHEQESDRNRFREREEYIRTIKREEEDRKLGNKLSAVFSDPKVQELAQTCWLYVIGKVGFYSAIFEEIDID